MWQNSLKESICVGGFLVAGLVAFLIVWTSDTTYQKSLNGSLPTRGGLSAAPLRLPDSEVRLTKKDSSVEVTIDGKPFAVFNYGKEWMKPFVFPLYSPNQVNVLRERRGFQPFSPGQSGAEETS